MNIKDLLGFKKNRSKAKDYGYKEGFDEGYMQGYGAGIDHGIAQEKLARKPREEFKLDGNLLKEENLSLIDLNPFEISKDDVDDFLKQLKNACLTTKTPFPTQDQIKIITTPSRNISVSAGAGSGKSTTLFLRIYFMQHVLRIPLSNISVFSFTAASTREFRDGLVKLYLKMGVELPLERASKIVRTFHSKIFELYKASGGQIENIFEFIDDKNINGQSAEERALKLGGSGSNLGDKQKEILKNIYNYVYESSSDFKEILDSMYKEYLKGRYFERKEYSRGTVESHMNRDHALTYTAEYYYEDYLNGFDTEDINLTGKYREFSVRAFKCQRTGALVFVTLSADDIEKLSHKEKGKAYLKRFENISEFDIKSSFKVKKTLVASYVSQDCFIADNREKLLDVLEFIENDFVVPKQNPAIFEMKLIGEQDDLPVYQTLYNCCSYIQIMGLVPSDVLTITRLSKLTKLDRMLCESLLLYWPLFKKYVQHNNITFFGDMFANFNEDSLDELRCINASITSMNHIIIDEFQDISPDVVKWIRGVLKANKLNDGSSTSIMTVGDDAQSIYSWKGSCPEFLSDYDKHFPSIKVDSLQLRHNFRCPESVIRIAESALHYATDIKKKRDTPCRADDESTLVKVVDSDNLDEFLNQLDYEIFNSSISTNFMILSATRHKKKEGIEEIKRRCLKRGIIFNKKVSNSYNLRTKNDQSIEFHTYYTSKGLEADVCFLFGDTGYSDTYPFRNMVVEASMLKRSSTYDQMQQHEARRLLYVALSRAKKRLVWFRGAGKSPSVYGEIEEVGWKKNIKNKGLGLSVN